MVRRGGCLILLFMRLSPYILSRGGVWAKPSLVHAAWACMLLVGLLAGSARSVHGQADTLIAITPSAVDSSVADVSALETRAARLRAQRRSKTIQHPSPGFLSKMAVRLQGFVERNQIVIDLPEFDLGGLDLSGLQPVLGGLRSGAGTTGGLRYEGYENQPRRTATIEALASLRRYYGASAVYGIDEDLTVGYAFARFWHMPQEAFYGVGAGAPNREAARETAFRRDEFLAGVLAGVSPAPNVLTGASFTYMTQRVGKGSGKHPDIEEVFDTAQIPGYGGDADFLMAGLWGEFDARDVPYGKAYGSRFAPTERRLRGISLDATSGLYAAAEVTPHVSIGGGPYSFVRAEAETQQYVPLRNAFQVIALRQFISIAQPWPGHEVPFFLMQTLGGGSSLRGYSGFRFRDRHAVLLNTEYRWQVLPLLDLALFLDAGHVFDDVRDIGYENVRAGYGIGLRFKAGEQVIARFDVAYGEEGFKTYLELGSIL